MKLLIRLIASLFGHAQVSPFEKAGVVLPLDVEVLGLDFPEITWASLETHLAFFNVSDGHELVLVLLGSHVLRPPLLMGVDHFLHPLVPLLQVLK